uniref:EF-hand domain-containing protein n=1 Tax=Corethron hystrix TaxID=216773 RepID=A0A7S1BTW0_9STRA|mmetsp:Transcript_40873/g.95877  ORF Transcript_40873/g.95877 Transcript_40873/m.95877 type:complete len:135 (+) Transcript_40873:211-615(+)
MSSSQTISPIFAEENIDFSQQFKDKVRAIHELFDKDGDGFLNFEELRSLQLTTSGQKMDETHYVMACRALDCHPKQGLSLDALRLTYASEGSSVDDDFGKVFSVESSQKKDIGRDDNDDDGVIEVGEGGVDISP